MAKLVLLCCLWLASIRKIVASSPSGFDYAVDQSIDHLNGEYLYERADLMESFTTSNLI